ncbi:uncharacterized protein LOC131927208 [Physella acuta]|uniref:uncharacterized protein LOC131927208 n=1 Tax=Physella acuta TaxID=109671 RepID=UPI0027DDE61E|nr:uncharacterized protein LOC131927208 [Physella acuta]XP_059138927.1 uncharacterized protein LOC131927208 [Physella acuta]
MVGRDARTTSTIMRGHAVVLPLLVMLWCATPVFSTTCETIAKNGEAVEQNVCESETNTDGCRKFVESFNSRDLPSGYPSGEQAEPPVSIDITPLNTFYQNGYQPGMRVVWQNMIGSKAKGYLITNHMKLVNGDAKIVCRLIKLTQQGIQQLQAKKLTFSLDFPYIGERSMNNVTVHSLPAPKFSDRSRPKSLLKMMVSAGTYYIESKEPADWIPTLAVGVQDQSVIVKFARSPPSYMLTKFKIVLEQRSPDSPIDYITVQEKEEEHGVYKPELPDAKVVFENVLPELYRIRLYVIDPYRMKTDQCQCWKTDENMRYCTNTCGIQHSCHFYVGPRWYGFHSTSKATRTGLSLGQLIPTAALLTLALFLAPF